MTGVGMVNIRLKHLVEDIDRHGNVRLYIRLPGRPKVRIREKFGTDEFMAAYNNAVSSKTEDPRQANAVKRGTFRHLCIIYYDSTAFTEKDWSTQAWQRRHLDAIALEHGEKPVAMMQGKHVRNIRDDIKNTPGASKTRLKALRALFSWAVEAEEAPYDPTLGVKANAYVIKGHHSWSIDEIEQYEHRHPLGSKARLAMALLLYTSWRREDAVRLGPQHIVAQRQEDGTIKKRIKYRQAKNEDRNPIDMDVPLFPELETTIATTKSGHLTFLVTEYGKPFTPDGFGGKFKDWCRQADLPHCSAHGLRKARAARLAERGATAHEIMAITGLRSLEEAERYTRAARQAGLADSAMAKLKGSR